MSAGLPVVTPRGKLPMLFRTALFLPLLLIMATPAMAGYISLDEEVVHEIDGIYSQASFGNQPIDFAGLPPAPTLYSNTLASIDGPNEFDSLVNIADTRYSPFPIVDIFYVDAITDCAGVAAIGCGGGHVIALVSSAAAETTGVFPGYKLLAHELGHVLGLPDIGFVNGAIVDCPDNERANLMCIGNNSTFGTDLTTTQADDARASLIATQTNDVISLLPIAVVPEPARISVMFSILGILLLALQGRIKAL